MKSKIEITFVSSPLDFQILTIVNSLSGFKLKETFTPFRQANAECEIGVSGAATALNYLTAVSLDYNSTGLYTITLLGDVVTIEAVQEGVVFSVFQNTTLGAVTTVIINQPATPQLTIDDITFSEADADPCNNIKVNVTTSELATKVTSPLIIDPNVDNPFEFDWVREVTINIACETATLNTSLNVQLPDILSVGTTQVNIFNTPTGGNVTVTHTSSNLLTLQYSLDDITYQSSNVFNGLIVDTYTMYVKDQFGCNISIPFEIVIFTPDISVTVPDFALSKAMSIRFKRDIVWNNCTDYKNEENTLSCEYNSLLNYKEIQKFQTCDLEPTQFRTNYQVRLANVIKEDGTKDALTIVKKTTNLDKKDKRDATWYDIDGTTAGIYFTSGDTYDYDTGLQNGTYELNGELPEWAIINNFVFLDGIGWFTIVDKFTSNEFNADVIVIEYDSAPGTPTSIIVSSNYNLFNYDVFEFDVDMAVYDNQQIQVEVLATDDTFTNIRELSELLWIDERWEDTIEIRYWNLDNTDVFYATGIKNKIRPDVENFQPNIEPSSEGLNTDQNSILLNARIYETNILTLSPCTIGIMRQVTQALSHKELYLDGVQYRLADDGLEVENYGQTNLVVVTATLIKSGNVYNTEFEGTSNQIDGQTELIGLLQNGNDYIKV